MRILLKLSGEALAGEKKTGFDEPTVRKVAAQIKQVIKDNEIAIVIGGGNFWRGRTSGDMDRVKADQIGMLATVMNCMFVSEVFKTEGIDTEVFTPFTCGTFTSLYSKEEAVKSLKAGKVVFLAGGTGATVGEMVADAMIQRALEQTRAEVRAELDAYRTEHGNLPPLQDAEFETLLRFQENLIREHEALHVMAD